MFNDPVYAAAPFDHAKADIILRSSDNVDFRVFKLLLSLASPLFETLFDLPQPAASEGQEVKDGLVVILVTETSRTLDCLFRLCYPHTLTGEPNLELKDVSDILEAARKYSLAGDAIEKKVRQVLKSSEALEANPLHCFAIAYQGRLREETLLAAKATLAQSRIPKPRSQGLALITGNDLVSLQEYHRKCGEAVYDLRRDLSWITSHYGSPTACFWLSGHQSTGTCDCTKTDESTGRYTLLDFRCPIWWGCFMQETFRALRDKPCRATIQAFAEQTVQVVKALDCPACSPRVAKGMRDFSEVFIRKVEKTVSQVELELEF